MFNLSGQYSLYIHIPFCNKKCDYCDFYSISSSSIKKNVNELNDEYVDSVINEVKYYVKHYNIKEWKSLYIGGGTPSLLSGKSLKRLVESVTYSAPFCDGYEATVEVNPESLTESFLTSAKESGINRISMGIQAINDKVLDIVNRGCKVNNVYDALNLLDRSWPFEISIDFIAGLPGHTYKDFKKQFDLISKYKINHVSLYTLTVGDNTPLGIKINSNQIKWSVEKADKMWIKGSSYLKKMGFTQYEVSNFCKNDKPSIHNSQYWKLNNYIGCGAGATGSVYNDNIRWTNTLSIPVYEKFWLNYEYVKGNIPRSEEILDLDTQAFEYVMMGFRMREGVSSKLFKQRFNKSLEEYIGFENGVFKRWKDNKLTKVSKRSGDIYYALNARGLLLLNRFLEELM